MRLFWMEQLLLTCWSYKNARWLNSMSIELSNSETFLRDAHNKEELFRYLAEWIATLQLDGKMIVSIIDDVDSSRNHKHLIITWKRIQECSFVCVMLCRMAMTGLWYAQQTHVVPIGLWITKDTGMPLCNILAYLVYPNLGPDPIKALTYFFCILDGCDTTFCFSERAKKSCLKLVHLFNSETFLPGTSKLSRRKIRVVSEQCMSNSQHYAVLL